MDRAETGRRGEAVAAQYYRKRGCRLQAHNYRTRFGELDLVVEDGEILVVCEVKTRRHGNRISGAEAVDFYKQQRIIAATQQFLQESGRGDRAVRFDVAEVTPLPEGKWQIHVIQNAFTL